MSTKTASLLLAGSMVFAAGAAFAQGGMMGGGGQGMMRGNMDRGMMSQDNKKQTERGMMGGGMMQDSGGMMCPMMGSMMQGGNSSMMHGETGGMGSLFGSRVVPMMNLSVDDVRGYLSARLERLGNKRLKVGNISAEGGSITADIVTADNSLVQRMKVDRASGDIEYEN